MNLFLRPEDHLIHCRQQQFLAEAQAERLAALLPRKRLHLRKRLAHTLVALAAWLSPEVARPAPRLELLHAARRNGHS